MKLYTNRLTIHDLSMAMPPDVTLLGSEHGWSHNCKLVNGPRSRKFIHVRLCAWEPRGKGANYRLTSGGRGSYSLAAWNATWDEHGLWMARLFDIDPRLKITGANTYDGYMDFHRKTEWKYPTETCGDLTCEKCYTRKPIQTRIERRTEEG